MKLGKLLVILVAFACAGAACAQAPGRITWNAVDAYRNMDSSSSVRSETREFFRELSDDQRIEDMVAYLQSKDKSTAGTPYELDFNVADSLLGMLRADPDLITDFSHLRSMIRDEGDPRRFFLLTKIAMVFTTKRKIDFSQEMRHMLLKNGKITSIPRGWAGMGFEDVSSYTYGQIMTTLNRMDIDHPFEESVNPSSSELEKMSKWLEDVDRSKKRIKKGSSGIVKKRTPERDSYTSSEVKEDGSSKIYTVALGAAAAVFALAIGVFVRSKMKN